MDKLETKMLFGLIAKLHPRFNDHSGNDGIVTTWHTMLGDIDFDCACEALKIHAATNDFPPTIADIRKGAAKLTTPALPTAGEAWQEVQRAISILGIYREREALASMHPATQRAVKQIGWQTLCMTEHDDLMATRAHFFKLYGAVADKAKDEHVMLPEIREKIAALAISATPPTRNRVAQIEQKESAPPSPKTDFADGLQQIGGILTMLGGQKAEDTETLSIREKAAKQVVDLQAYIRDQENLEKVAKRKAGQSGSHELYKR
ncbi:MAG: hypothetical protein LBE55_01435 [Clostridiales bacterium]|jgi:hypothetical protein|nr:hypothetical protein [Clostridiales bacterium]